MSWLLFITLMAATADTPIEVSEPIETTIEPSSELPTEPDLELLLFLAEWDDSDNDQWLDPEVFSTDNEMNQQLDTQKALQNETDPDHN